MLRHYFANRRNKKMRREHNMAIEVVADARLRNNVDRIAHYLSIIAEELKKKN